MRLAINHAKVRATCTAVSDVSRSSAMEWRAPDWGVAKVQVDGGLARKGRSWAIATMCRDHSRDYFLGSSAIVFNDISELATLEALACREALALALDLSLDRIVIACDCKAVVTEIKNGTEGR